MPESSIRWGSRLGALGAGLGVFAYIAGSLLTPLPSRQSTGEVVIPIILIRGLFLYVALGVVLGLAFYGGLRVAREQFGDSQTQAGEAHTDSIDRMPAALAGVLVVLIWWLVTRFVSALVAFPPVSRLAAQDFAGQLFFGVVFACIGAGLGAVGARMTVRNKLAETVIVVTPPAAPAARAAMPGVADGTIPPEGARSREPGQVTAPEE